MKRLLRRLLCALLVLLVLAAPALGAVNVRAADVTTSMKPYIIAVVYDNSGSMYNNQTYWCQAKFAMEIFASMLNYENGDKLVIFPMGTVTTDGRKDQGRASFDPIEINGLDDLEVINNLYTVDAGKNTPFRPVMDAHAYLNRSEYSGYDKWLVVLTDGRFTGVERADDPSEGLEVPLTDYASRSTKLYYLGFGEAKEETDKLTPDIANGFYVEKNTKKSLNSRLVNVCNTIFERDELKDLSGKKLTFGLSMRKVVVYVQGESSSINSLTEDSSGKNFRPASDSGQRKYSTLSCLKYEDKAVTDKSLAGQVVTYTNCPAGDYILDYELSKDGSIQVFYEPAVDVSVTVRDSDGNEVDLSAGKVSTGHYTVEYCIVDAVTGEDVTDSPLLKVENFGARLELSDGTEIPVENGQEVQFPVDDELDLIVEGDYLGKYHISTKDSPDKFPPLRVEMPGQQTLSINASTKQIDNWFQTGKHSSWNPIILDVKLGGEKLTDEQLEALDLDITFENDLEYSCRIIEGKSAFEIMIGHNDDGEYTDPACDAYKMTAVVSTVDEFDRETSAKDTLRFEIRSYSMIWKWLGILLALVIIAILIWLWGSRPALPKSVYVKFENDNRLKDTRLNRQTGGINLSGTAYGRVLPGTAKPLTNNFKARTPEASFEFTNLAKPPFGVIEFSIGNKRYMFDEDENGFYEEDKQGDGMVDLKKLKFQITNNKSISWKVEDPQTFETREYNGKIIINPKNK